MLAIGVGGTITSKVLSDEAIAFFITGNGTVWFLMTLFLSESFFVWVRSLKNDWILVLSALALVGIPFFLSSKQPFLIVANRFFSAYFFIVLGFYVSKLMRKYHNWTIPVGIVALFVWLFLVYKSSWSFSFFDGSFNSFLPTITTVIFGCLGLVFLFSHINSSHRVAEYIGKNSLIIMLMHPTFVLIGIYGIYPLLHIQTNIGFVFFSIALVVFVYGLSMLCVPFIRKYVPFVIGEKKRV